MTKHDDGPTRHELLLQVMKYNGAHHKIDHIMVSNASKSSDLVVMRQMVMNEKNASESVRQLKDSIKELQALQRHQLKKGPVSSRCDWEHILAAGKKLIDAAEKGIATCDAQAVAKHDARSKIKEDLSKRL